MRVSTELGRLAEQAAANYLEQLGFAITRRNWRTKWCEVDLVAEHRGEIHLIEVKYRRRTDYGDGFAAVTADKAARLRRASLAFGASNQPVLVDVVSVTGQPGGWEISLIENAILAT